MIDYTETISESFTIPTPELVDEEDILTKDIEYFDIIFAQYSIKSEIKTQFSKILEIHRYMFIDYTQDDYDAYIDLILDSITRLTDELLDIASKDADFNIIDSILTTMIIDSISISAVVKILLINDECILLVKKIYESILILKEHFYNETENSDIENNYNEYIKLMLSEGK